MKTTSYKSIVWKSGSAIKLLLFFFENPNKEFYERQVQKGVGLSAGAVNKYLKLLSGESFILMEKRGKMNFFRLNRENLVAKHLKISHNLSEPVVAGLKKLGEEFGVKLYIYGSVARGEDDENSDWDILVIGSMKVDEMEREINKLRKKFGRRIKLSIFKRIEWLEMAKKDPAFYENVEKDKIGLV